MISRLKDTLLLVGDGTSDRVNLREIFESSYDLLEAENVAQALMLLKQNISCIAAILADIPLADDESVRALSSACSDKAEYRVPVMLLIDPADKGEEEERAFASYRRGDCTTLLASHLLRDISYRVCAFLT